MGGSIVLLIFILFVFFNKHFEGSGKPQSPEYLKLAWSKKETVQMSLCFLDCPVPLCHYTGDWLKFKKKTQNQNLLGSANFI